jgi:hypothetical protein
MAAQHIVIADIDGPPSGPGQPNQGTCQINVDGDTATGLVTAVNFWNTTPTAKQFTVSNAQRSRQIAIPAGTASPAAPSTITPPFNPGNWTPTISQRPNGNWALDASIDFVG